VSLAPSIDTGLFGVDAYTGAEAVTGRFAENYAAWVLSAPSVAEAQTLAPTPPDETDWADERVGWGVILAEPPGATPQTLAKGDDAPEPIRELIKRRKGKVLRYRPGANFAAWTLRDYAGRGDLLNAASPPGSGPRQLPMYLLIYGSPAEIPWHVQYTLNPVRYVGRLDLTGDALANYVGALLEGWPRSRSRYAAPVVWAVDHGGGDITTLMRTSIAAELFSALSSDPEITSPTYVDGSRVDATGAALADALAANQPSLVITSSHGMTGPLENVDRMRETLGLLVDQQFDTVEPRRLLEAWQPDGAIWFAQACCSAGADNPSSYSGLFKPGELLDNVLTGIAEVGATTAPLPRALLGAPNPLRAFVGHVEPTFAWTLAFPPSGQQLTWDLKKTLYENVCLGKPIGLAMNDYYQAIGSMLLSLDAKTKAFESAAGAAARQALDMAVYFKVTAYDRANTVILGDPTAAVPLPAR
jgi:hypothetical protein